MARGGKLPASRPTLKASSMLPRESDRIDDDGRSCQARSLGNHLEKSDLTIKCPVRRLTIKRTEEQEPPNDIQGSTNRRFEQGVRYFYTDKESFCCATLRTRNADIVFMAKHLDRT